MIEKPVDIIDVVESYGIRLIRYGDEFTSICPFHDDHHRSLKVNQAKQIFKCFACGAGGDYYTFKKLMGDKPEILAKAKKRNETKFNQIIPVPVDRMSESPSFKHSRLGLPDRIYPYLGVNGELNGYVCRFDLEEGKEVLPYTYGEKGGQERWMFSGFPEPRPLYNLQHLKAAKSILIVEGEKTADFAQKLLPNAAVLTWIGGARSVKKANWGPVIESGLPVYMWPDNDTPGIEAMDEISVILSEGGLTNINKISLDPSWPEHFDAADTGWNTEQMQNYLNNNNFKLL